MKLNFKRDNGYSFLHEVGKRKVSINVNVDDFTMEPKGKYSDKWESVDISDNEWSLIYYFNDEFILEFTFEMNDDGLRSLTPINFILWEGDTDGVILDEGDFFLN